MRIESTGSPVFRAGNVKFCDVPESIISKHYEKVRQIAQNSNIDILFLKKGYDDIAKKDIYCTVAEKDVPVHSGGTTIGFSKILGFCYSSISPDADANKLSVNLYNSVIKSIKSLEKKIL